jgi:hypothetical protein
MACRHGFQYSDSFMTRYCSTCGITPVRFEQRTCTYCHAAWMRRNRRPYRDFTPEEKRRADARSKAGIYKRRGILVQQPCEACGETDSQMHHPDYAKPLAVRWLCEPCHLELHREMEAYRLEQLFTRLATR